MRVAGQACAVEQFGELKARLDVRAVSSRFGERRRGRHKAERTSAVPSDRMPNLVVVPLDVLRVALSIPLLAAAAGVVAAGVLYPSGFVSGSPRLRALAQSDTYEWIAALCPALAPGLFAVVTVIWDKRLLLPQPEFYRLAAEVIPLAFLALVIEGKVLASFSNKVILAWYGLLFVAGEVAAFIAVSGSVRGSHGFRVGGSHAFSEVLSRVTTAALVAAAVLSAAAVISRALTVASDAENAESVAGPGGESNAMALPTTRSSAEPKPTRPAVLDAKQDEAA